MSRRMRWPRCGFRYVTSPGDVRAGRWRTCILPWGHWLAARFRHQGPLAEAPSPPEEPPDLIADLRDYLFRILADTPRGERGRWVMSAEWLNECRKLDRWQSPFSAWQPSITIARPETLLGIPIEVRDDAGAPWLEAAAATMDDATPQP